MLRDRFPIFENKVFINSCSKGALSIDVQQAYQQYLTDWATDGSPWDHWVGQMEGLRSKFAGLIHAQPDEVAIKTSVSDAVNALASGLDFSGERNKVIVDEYAFPTTAQIWHAQTGRGAEVVHVREADDATIPLEYYEQVIDERTLLVSLTQVCYRHGARQDVRPIIELAHQRGALVLLDSFQALGTLPIDVDALNVDFLTGGSLKYLLGSAGLAFLYVRDGHIEQLYPTATGWFAQSDIFAMDIYGHSPSPSARRFESGTPPNPNVYAGIAGLDIIAEVGVDAIDQHLKIITGAIKDKARDKGYTVTTPDLHGAMIAIRTSDMNQVVSGLGQAGIIVSSRDGNIRISPHLYNELADVDALFDVLAKYEQLLC